MANAISTRVCFENILIPTDFTVSSEQALKYGKVIAAANKSHLLLAHVSPPLNPSYSQEAAWLDASALALQMEEGLQRRKESLRAAGYRVDAVSVIGSLTNEILSIVKSTNVDLIVLGAHEPRGLERLLFGSDSECILRHVACPVIVLGPGVQDAAQLAWPPRKILCATTLRQDSALTAAYACTLAHQFQARLELVNVDVQGQQHTAGAVESFLRALQSDLPAAMRHTLPPGIVGLSREEHPATGIVEYATQWGADLIVMGAHNASAMTTHFIYGTAARVPAEAHCPVMTLHL